MRRSFIVKVYKLLRSDALPVSGVLIPRFPPAVMTRHLVLMVHLVLVLAACSRGAAARVRLNSIRTVILREAHAMPVNRSAWEPSVDLTVSARDVLCDVMCDVRTALTLAHSLACSSISA